MTVSDMSETLTMAGAALQGNVNKMEKKNPKSSTSTRKPARDLAARKLTRTELGTVTGGRMLIGPPTPGCCTQGCCPN